jgi:hypothetical protein
VQPAMGAICLVTCFGYKKLLYRSPIRIRPGVKKKKKKEEMGKTIVSVSNIFG